MVAEMGREQPAQSNSPEDRDAWGLDENGCHPSCPIRILGEQSGVSKSNARPNCYGNTYRAKHNVGADLSATPYNQNNVHDDTGTAARYFAQFYPHDEPAQERE